MAIREAMRAPESSAAESKKRSWKGAAWVVVALATTDRCASEGQNG
jgi:hypothetical protein